MEAVEKDIFMLLVIEEMTLSRVEWKRKVFVGNP